MERARRITDGSANDLLLYFTSPSLTAAGRTLVFISDRAPQAAQREAATTGSVMRSAP